MQQLYSQMWKRLNGDEQRYRDEASDYFSYVLAANNEGHCPSMFELWVALDERLQKAYLEKVVPQSTADVMRGCERLKTKILTRCAGLLELVSFDEEESDEDEEKYEKEDTTRLPKISKIKIKLGRELKKLQDSPIREYHDLEVSFLHRTARDFLRETEDGRSLLGEPSTSDKPYPETILKAKITILVQGLAALSPDPILRLMYDFGRLKKEKVFLCTLKKVCQALSVPGRSEQDFSCREFWQAPGDPSVPYKDFEGAAAYASCAEYLHHFVDNMDPHASPTYLGYLFFCDTIGSRFVVERTKLAMLVWLASRGADLLQSINTGALCLCL